MLSQLVVLLAISSSAVALSSHSPVDLEAYPAFAVSFLAEHPILNETALELLDEQLETPPHSLPPKRHLLRTPSGQGFLCTVPSVTIAEKRRAQRQAELDESTRQLERQRGLERGLALLEPMRGGCIYLKQNWFTYSFCYGSEIRQFHAVQVAGSPTPKEDPNAEAYTLGHSPEPSIYSSNPKYGSGSLQLAKKEALIPSTLGGLEGVGLDESGRYLVQIWEGGTTCDKTGLPRTVEVQFHCNTQTIDRIALIRETSICRYVLLIHTPRLCAEPLFLEGAGKSSEPASTIECQPIVSKLPNPEREQISSTPEATDQGEVGRAKSEGTEEESRQGESLGETLLVDQPVLANDGLSTSDHIPEGVKSELDAEYVDATLMLVYNPETGEIESVETTVGDSLGGGGDNELRRKVFGGGDKGENGKLPGESDSREEQKKPISVDRLEDMVRLMTQSLAEAMKNTDRRPASDHEQVESQPQAPPSSPDSRDPTRKQQLDVMSLLKEVWGVDAASTGTLSQEQLDRMSKAQQKFQEQQRRRQQVEQPKNEAFEQMRKGFERRYEEDEEEERGSERPRDEL
ncbi:hypothetical protein JCM3765_005670 [Sporobolomyces pararoseus]